MQKKAIAVYDPEDPLERAIQDNAHKFNGGWLPSHECQLMAQSIASLKAFDTWMGEINLLDHRMSYFFDPKMIANRDIMVFVTKPIFIRDIFENDKISTSLHDPIVFMTKPLAHFLHREYGVHIHVDCNNLFSLNDRENFVDIGGLMISLEDAVITDECIDQILYFNKPDGHNQKAASTLIRDGVFGITDHKKELLPNVAVWNKTTRRRGTVQEVQPGEEGLVTVMLDDGVQDSFAKSTFDQVYSAVQ